MNEDSPRYPGWRVAAASALGVFLASVLAYSFSVLLKPLAHEFSWTREEISRAYGVMAVMTALTAPMWGRLLDRFGPRRIIVICLVVVGSAFGSLALQTGRVWHFHLVFGCIGAVVAGTTALAYSRAVSTWFRPRRGMALGLILAGGAIGAMVHPPTTQALIGRIGWRAACLVLGGAVVVVGVPNALCFVRERPRTGAAGETLDGTSVRDALRSRVLWTILVMAFGSALAMNGVIVHMAPLLTDRGVPAGKAAMAISAMGGASLLGRLATGWMLDRFAGPRVSFGLLTLSALGTFLLAKAPSFEMGVWAAMLIGAGSGGELDVLPYLLSRYFGLRSLAALYGLAWTVMGIAGAAGPVLLGRAFDASGSYEAQLVGFALAVLGIGVLVLWLPAYDAPRLRAAASITVDASR